MTLHRSLKTKPAALNQHRNVLTRAERIERLADQNRFNDGDSPIGLPKTANRKAITAKKKKKGPEEGAAADTKGKK